MYFKSYDGVFPLLASRLLINLLCMYKLRIPKLFVYKNMKLDIPQVRFRHPAEKICFRENLFSSEAKNRVRVADFNHF